LALNVTRDAADKSTIRQHAMHRVFLSVHIKTRLRPLKATFHYAIQVADLVCDLVADM